MARTPLPYYGGKQRLAERIVTLMPRHTAYLEPFAGGAAVLFAKPRAARETINDLDGQVMGFWRSLRNRPEELAAAIYATPYGRTEWELCSEPAGGDLEAARRFLVNVGQSFSRERSAWSAPTRRDGGWRPGTWSKLPAQLLVAADRLRGVCLECGDALQLISRWDLPGTVIYLDPPYVGKHRKRKDKGYRCDAGPDLWPDLVDTLLRVKRAAVLLSGYPCAEAEHLGWRSVPLPAKRSVSAAEDEGLARAPETLWLSPTVPEQLPNLLQTSAA